MRVSKQVKFYDVKLVTTDAKGKETAKAVDSLFWKTTLDRVEAITDAKKRIESVSRVRYYGAVLRPKTPPVDHLQVGRLRDLSDHLETTDLTTGAVTPLTLGDPNLRVSEPTFVVPFGNSGRVAMLSPGKATRQETIGHWLTLVLNLAPKGKAIRFVPVVNEDALNTILGSQGAVGIDFNIAQGTDLADIQKGKDSLLTAVSEVLSKGPKAGVLKVGWTLGYDGSTADRNLIKSIAYKVATGGFAERATVNLLVANDDGDVRHETHNVFEDHIVEKVSYQIDADQVSSSTIILNAVGQAIKDFTSRIKP